MRSFDYLSRDTVKFFLPFMIEKNVSETARKKGFTKIYLENKNPFETMATKRITWHQKRHAYLKRRLAQPYKLFDKNGMPTRYHLSLISWGYSPSKKIRRFLG